LNIAGKQPRLGVYLSFGLKHHDLLRDLLRFIRLMSSNLHIAQFQ